MSGAVKHDQGKLDLSLVPRSAMDSIAEALGFGAQKYGRDNYKKGMESHRLIAACLRHVTAWQDGEDADPESGLSHLSHALACLAMLGEQKKRGTLQDTRTPPPFPTPADLDAAEREWQSYDAEEMTLLRDRVRRQREGRAVGKGK